MSTWKADGREWGITLRCLTGKLAVRIKYGRNLLRIVSIGGFRFSGVEQSDCAITVVVNLSTLRKLLIKLS
jgi:hypothetical protein